MVIIVQERMESMNHMLDDVQVTTQHLHILQVKYKRITKGINILELFFGSMNACIKVNYIS